MSEDEVSQEIPIEFCHVVIKEEPVDHSEDEQEAPVTHIEVKIQNSTELEECEEKPGLPPSPTTGSFACEICTKEFPQRRYMVAHRKRHPEYKVVFAKLEEDKRRLEEDRKRSVFPCLHCPKSFINRSRVNRHMKSHIADRQVEKNFICDFCDKRFAYRRDLIVHLRVHTGEKPYKCEQCSRSFSQLSSLMYHVTGHAEIKPYQCDLCSKSFTRKRSLVYHKRIHANERPFECQFCHKAFTTRRTLRNHEKLHGEKQFACELCKKKFHTKQHVNLHMATHRSSDEFFPCGFCDRKFTRKFTLTKHLKKHEGSVKKRKGKVKVVVKCEKLTDDEDDSAVDKC